MFNFLQKKKKIIKFVFNFTSKICHRNLLTNSFQGNFQRLKELDAEFCRSLLAENLALNFSAAGSFFSLYMLSSLSKIASVWIPLQAVVPIAGYVLVVFSLGWQGVLSGQSGFDPQYPYQEGVLSPPPLTEGDK